MRMIQYISFSQFYSFSLFFSWLEIWPREFKCVYWRHVIQLLWFSLPLLRHCEGLPLCSWSFSVLLCVLTTHHHSSCSRVCRKNQDRVDVITNGEDRLSGFHLCQRNIHAHSKQSASEHATLRQINRKKKVWRRNFDCLHCILSFFYLLFVFFLALCFVAGWCWFNRNREINLI